MRISSVEMWNNNLYLILFFVNVVYAQNSDLLSILNGLPNTNLPINLTIDDFFIGNGIFLQWLQVILAGIIYHCCTKVYKTVSNGPCKVSTYSQIIINIIFEFFYSDRCKRKTTIRDFVWKYNAYGKLWAMYRNRFRKNSRQILYGTVSASSEIWKQSRFYGKYY